MKNLPFADQIGLGCVPGDDVSWLGLADNHRRSAAVGRICKVSQISFLGGILTGRIHSLK